MAKTQRPWTSEQTAELMEHMKTAPTVKKGFNEFALKHGRTGAAVQQRYYMELRKTRPAKTRAAKPKVRNMSVTGHGAAPTPKPVAAAFTDASISELIEVNRQVMNALESKMGELAKLRSLV